MSDELRGKIKELIAQGCGCDRYCKKHPEDCGCAKDADAAIALIRAEVLEEAAKVAEKTFGEGYHVAAVIRAMKGRP